MLDLCLACSLAGAVKIPPIFRQNYYSLRPDTSLMAGDITLHPILAARQRKMHPGRECQWAVSSMPFFDTWSIIPAQQPNISPSSAEFSPETTA